MFFILLKQGLTFITGRPNSTPFEGRASGRINGPWGQNPPHPKLRDRSSTASSMFGGFQSQPGRLTGSEKFLEPEYPFEWGRRLSPALRHA